MVLTRPLGLLDITENHKPLAADPMRPAFNTYTRGLSKSQGTEEEEQLHESVEPYW